MSRRFKVKNCCENCRYATNYTGYDDFVCGHCGSMIRAERFDCEYFKPEGTFVKVTEVTEKETLKKDITSSLIEEVESSGTNIKEISDKLVSSYCKDLDEIMSVISENLSDSGSMTDTELEYYIMDLANTLYFVGTAQEDLGIKEDICKSIRQRVYSKARDEALGKTVADRTAQAELAVQGETLVLSIYSRTYKKVKLRMEAGYEMLNSLKKVMNKRIAEMELSNSRYINKSKGDD